MLAVGLCCSMVSYQQAKNIDNICVTFSLQKREAEKPKVEVVQVEEEEVVHDDNEWGEQQMP